MDKTVTLWKLLQQPGERPVLQELVPAQADSLDAASGSLPPGAYTTLRTYSKTKATHLESHFLRLEETARLAGRPLQLDHPGLRLALRQAVQSYNGAFDLRLRIQLDLKSDQLYLAAEPLKTPPELAYQQGVKVVTCSYVRHNPKAKLTSTMQAAETLRRSLPPDVNEALMIDPDGRLLEGLSSNFYAVLEGVLWTAELGVLAGITRQAILDEVRQANLPLHLEGLPLAELPRASEAFISSASRGVLPVCRIDSLVIGSGTPGPLTRQLGQRYQARIERDLEEI
ncbi:MAG: aminotransferase class IV [Anaerolineales bacterium]|nr:aminotransferase class IV [Anaerolineales bacterium]